MVFSHVEILCMSGEIFPFLIVLNLRCSPFSRLSTISSFEHSKVFQMALVLLTSTIISFLSLHKQFLKYDENASTALAIATNFNVVQTSPYS